MDNNYQVGIVGAGVSGSVIAMQLSALRINHIIIEQNESVVSGPPFCHLHVGGNLYPDISDEACRVLMKQSIEMARLFPQSIDRRPTLISIPKSEKYRVEEIEERLKMLVNYYKKLINEDPENAILGNPEDYYRLYTQKEINNFICKPIVQFPESPDDWMCNAVKLIDGEKLKMPIILVQEYGWNMFRLAAQAQITLEKSESCSLQLNTQVINIIDRRNSNEDFNWEIHTNSNIYKTKYLVNACGYRTGEIDQSLDMNVSRLIEFKAAYISKWKGISGLVPEFIFHGERCTPHGMAQLTPYYNNFYQIHGMTEDITLFDHGLVKSKVGNPQPAFKSEISKKLSEGWDQDEADNRTHNAIRYITKFVPSFNTASVGGPPLFGAQQIPGDDVNCRVGEVEFPTPFYARSEIVKASSALSIANEIIDDIHEKEIVNTKAYNSRKDNLLQLVSKDEIDNLSSQLADKRGYPTSLAQLLVDRVD